MKAVLIDIDGTLTDEQRRLDCRAVDAVRRLELPVILASGNVLCFVKCASKLIGASGYMIAENGGVISMGFDGPVEVTPLRARCLEVFKVLRTYFQLEELDGAERRSDVALRRNFDVKAARQVLLDEDINGMELVDTGFAVHIKNMEVNKGTALQKVADRMGLAPGDFAAIGDSVNDIEMLRLAGLGIAVGNAHPDVKGAADLVTRDTYGKGVVEALEYIEKNEQRS